jgi:hypothetical protein
VLVEQEGAQALDGDAREPVLDRGEGRVSRCGRQRLEGGAGDLDGVLVDEREGATEREVIVGAQLDGDDRSSLERDDDGVGLEHQRSLFGCARG